MNFNASFLPERTKKIRTSGITMMTDKGLSVRETDSFCEGIFPYTDFVKIAFGTSLLVPSLESKLNIYSAAKVYPIFGGTLFEVFYHRYALNDYCQYLDRFGMEHVEISDGTIQMDRQDKLECIRKFSGNYKVISQVTNDLPEEHLSFDSLMGFAGEEIDAGAKMIVIKESEKMPLYGKDGLSTYLHNNPDKISINFDQLIWDAPDKNQQIELINLFGNNVNVCNVAPDDVISLEAKRLGLHSSTLLKLIPPGKK